MTDDKNLNALAQQIARAKHDEKQADATYRAMMAEFESRPDVQAAKQAKDTAKAKRDDLEKAARAELESRWQGGAEVASSYYTIQTTISAEYDDDALVTHLIANAPALAAKLLKVDRKALDKIVTANAMKDGRTATWPEHFTALFAPVTLAVTPITRINWSKLPESEQGGDESATVADSTPEPDMSDVPF